ncbi:MAG: amidinotransferase [Deltaproteobacteria bacterium]|nr:amidinotransferase [Deltaproteobacteria bacterium]MBI2227557.1 amidinotransferase [Deltaproteobacteria bacterium]
MRVLMCAPDHYGIEYEINPWMSRSRQSHRPKAAKQWAELRRILQDRLSVSVNLVEPQPGVPDMVFAANAGVVWKHKFVVSNFRHDVRRPEAGHYAAWFRDRGFEIVRLSRGYYFEGEGDLLRCGETWFAGYHIRSDILAHQEVAEIIEREVLSLELTNDWFYHLDTCFCPLGEGRAIFYPGAFDPYARKVLANHIADLIPVSAREASRFACNAVVVGDAIVMNHGCPVLRQRLESAGFTVLEIALDEFIKAGGSAKCLVLNIG